jgi:hypothetical protein
VAEETEGETERAGRRHQRALLRERLGAAGPSVGGSVDASVIMAPVLAAAAGG